VEHLVQNALDAIEHRDWELLGRILHPYVHWTENDAAMRGRPKVLAHLAAHPVPNPPTSYQLRDGQIYRWTIDSGSGGGQPQQACPHRTDQGGRTSGG
jgi:hypothetical protein